MADIHRHLRAWRKRAGLTLEQVADLEGVGHSAVHKWEKGEVPVTLPRLESLARHYGASHPFELLFPPEHRDKGTQLGRIWQLLQRVDAADAAAVEQMLERLAARRPASSVGESGRDFRAAA